MGALTKLLGFGEIPKPPPVPTEKELEAKRADKQTRDIAGLRSAILAQQDKVGRNQLKSNPGLFIP